MKDKFRCCICGNEFEDSVLNGNNPDPLRDEDGKFLSESENPYCCKHCDNVYVTSYRIGFAYGLKDQCILTQKKVLELRKGWLNKPTYKEVDGVDEQGRPCKFKVEIPTRK